MVSWVHPSQLPNGIAIGSAVFFAGHICVTTTGNICCNRHISMQCQRCSLKSIKIKNNILMNGLPKTIWQNLYMRNVHIILLTLWRLHWCAYKRDRQIDVSQLISVSWKDMNSSGDEIANVNVFTEISHTYFRIPKREPTSFSKLDDN